MLASHHQYVPPQRERSRKAYDLSASKYVPFSWGSDFSELFAKLYTLEGNVNLSPLGAPPPERRAIGLAEVFLVQFHQIDALPDKIIATAEGGVAICFAEGNKYADIECFNWGAVLGVTTDRRGRPTVWEISQTSSEIVGACSRIKEFIGRGA